MRSLSWFSLLVLVLIAVQVIIYFLGALSPETAFDALWYHLTIPKIFLNEEKIFFIPGGLLYYSVMPKLIDLLYIPALFFGNEITAKLIHFGFGMLVLVSTYIFSKKFVSKEFSIIAVLILSSNLVFAWQSTTAFIDLGRTFFELLSLMAFYDWIEKKDKRYVFLSGLLMGISIGTKWLSVGSVFIFLFLFIILLIYKKYSLGKILRSISLWGAGVVVPVVPWILFSFLSTGVLFYPFFTPLYPGLFSYEVLSPVRFIQDIILIFTRSNDPILPIYLIILPLLFISFRKMKFLAKILFFFSIISFVIWYLEPRTGGGRFLLPYLPVYSIMVAVGIQQYFSPTVMKKFLLLIILILGISTIVYRGAASLDSIPTIFSQEKKREYMSENLNFDFGDFYDTDRFFENNMKSGDMVLIYGIHNLYYVNFPFIHESWITSGERFNFVLTQDTKLPSRFQNSILIYENDKTHIKLYKKERGAWVY